MRETLKRRQRAHVLGLDECAKVRADFDASAGGQKAFGRLGTSVANVRRGFKEQQGCLNDKKRFLEAIQTGVRILRTLLNGVVKVSALAGLEPSAAKVMQLPRRGSYELLQADGQAIYEQLTTHKDVFLAEGLAPNVLTDLPAQLEQLASNRAGYADAARRFTAATDEIRRALDEGDDAIEVCLAYLESQPNPNLSVIQKLRIAKRVGPRSTAKPETPAAAAPPPTASSAS